MKKHFSQACENNKYAILDKLGELLTRRDSVLEVGSGTGQHAVYFSRQLPHVEWQTSDLPINHESISQWITEDAIANCLLPLSLDVSDLTAWPKQKYSAVFTANSLHIMSWEKVEHFFSSVSSVIQPKGLLIIYGPFNYEGQFTSESNANFDRRLKDNDPKRGIRDIEAINLLADKAGLYWLHDFPMPANNRLQVWQLK